MVSTLEQLQVPNGTGPGFRRSKRWKPDGNYQPVVSPWFPRGFHFVETPFFRAVYSTRFKLKLFGKQYALNS